MLAVVEDQVPKSSCFNSLLEMPTRPAVLYNTHIEVLFQFSIGDAPQRVRVFAATATPPPFQFSIGDARWQLELARRTWRGTCFNSLLEMQRRRSSWGGVSRCFMFQFSIGDAAWMWIIASITSFIRFQFSIGDAQEPLRGVVRIYVVVWFQFSIGDADRIRVQGHHLVPHRRFQFSIGDARPSRVVGSRQRQRCKFQFSIGDAGRKIGEVQVAKVGDVSILYWRCRFYKYRPVWRP